MDAEDREKCIERIRMAAAALKEDLTELEKEDINMWQEIKTYLYGRNSG